MIDLYRRYIIISRYVPFGILGDTAFARGQLSGLSMSRRLLHTFNDCALDIIEQIKDHERAITEAKEQTNGV